MSKQKKILVIEDEQPLLEAIKAKLLSKKFDVLEAKNGKEGLEIAKSKKPDLILLDIVMPVMDGITVLHKLDDDTKTKNIPVIILTNLSDEEKIEESMRRGVSDYLVKSDWRLEDVVKKVEERLKK